MNEKTLRQCLDEAGRFVIKASAALERIRDDKYAFKRASMDLTRALANLRQGR